MSEDVNVPVPRLRAGVVLDKAGRALVDTVFVRKIKLDDTGLAILSALDAATMDELAERAGSDTKTVSTWLS